MLSHHALTFRYVAELLGVAVFAASGVLRAGRKGMDIIGVSVIAVVTGLGGGTVRDVLIDRRPIAWIADPLLLYVCLFSTLATILWVRRRLPPLRLLLIADALGLALFSIGGVQIAEQVGYGGIVAVLMGVITGTVGGVIRDLLSAEIPLVLRPGKLYVTAAVIGASLYLTLQIMGVGRPWASLIGMIVVAMLRFIAIRWNVQAPVPKLPADADV